MGGWVGGRKDVLAVEGFLDQDGVVLLLGGDHTELAGETEGVLFGRGGWVGGWVGES